MQLSRTHLTVLLNALYDAGVTQIPVSHPSSEIGELLRIELGDQDASTVRFTKGAITYRDTRSTVRPAHGDAAHDDLPDHATYLRALVAGGLIDIENRAEVETFVNRYGYADLAAGHTPVVAGIDTNIIAYRMPEVLRIDPISEYADERGRTPINGYALARGVKSELDWHYNHHSTTLLEDAFGPEFARLTNQPAGGNREGFLGLYEYRRLLADRAVDVVDCDETDEEIIAGYKRYDTEDRKTVLLFSNDYGFIERAADVGLKAQHVKFPVDIPRSVSASWRAIEDTLYHLTVLFGVLKLPKATLYGVWNGKTGLHWQHEQLDIDCRSPRLTPQLERDLKLIRAFDQL